MADDLNNDVTRNMARPVPENSAVSRRPSDSHQPNVSDESDDVEIPTAPKLLADLGLAIQRNTSAEPPSPKYNDDSDRTRGYTPELIDELLHADESPSNLPTSAADADTRIGEVPLEELMGAIGARSARQVGHDDETKAYNPSASATADAEDTVRVDRGRPKLAYPGIRVNRAKPKPVDHEPNVVVQAEPRPTRRRWLPLLGLVGVVAVISWAYRFSIARHVREMRSAISEQSTGELANRAPRTNPITVSISASPADARIVLDGVQVTNPFLAERPLDKSIHELMIDAPGYSPTQRNVQFERDITIVVALAPLAPVAPVTPAVPPLPDSASTVGMPSVPKRALAAKGVSNTMGAAEPKPIESPKPDCNPPYTVDDLNIKTFKRECLKGFD